MNSVGKIRVKRFDFPPGSGEGGGRSKSGEKMRLGQTWKEIEVARRYI